jgi:hypothetical protein
LKVSNHTDTGLVLSFTGTYLELVEKMKAVSVKYQNPQTMGLMECAIECLEQVMFIALNTECWNFERVYQRGVKPSRGGFGFSPNYFGNVVKDVVKICCIRENVENDLSCFYVMRDSALPAYYRGDHTAIARIPVDPDCHELIKRSGAHEAREIYSLAQRLGKLGGVLNKKLRTTEMIHETDGMKSTNYVLRSAMEMVLEALFHWQSDDGEYIDNGHTEEWMPMDVYIPSSRAGLSLDFEVGAECNAYEFIERPSWLNHTESFTCECPVHLDNTGSPVTVPLEAEQTFANAGAGNDG